VVRRQHRPHLLRLHDQSNVFDAAWLACLSKSTRNKIEFNGVGGLRNYISFTQRIWQNVKMHAQRRDRRGDLIPAIVTLIVAVVGTAGILNDFGSGNDSQQGSGNPRMITAAAVSRAGAIEIPSEPTAGRG
jgi:hypothetical protein